jgi:endo-1,4-beta-xylanase
MVAFSSVLLALGSVAAVLASPVNITEREPNFLNLITRQTQPGTGTHNGFFYSYWTDGRGSIQYKNEAGGKYSATWSNVGNWVGGKGWNPGGPRVVKYSGSWNAANQNSYVALYGWTRSPLIEYYIVEAYGSYNPSSAAQRKATINVDGSTYDILQTTRTNQPSIDGTSTFQQFWSVRQQKRVGGSIDVGAHFNAWANAGMRLGTQHNYMILATEGYQSSGSATITVEGP